MDYIQLTNWLMLIATVCTISAAGLVAFEVGGWIIDWINGYRERRAARKRNHAHPYDWNKNDWKGW
jgi:predicted sugar kinase